LQILIGLGVSAPPGSFSFDYKLPETTNKDILFTRKIFFYELQKLLNNIPGLTFAEAHLLGNRSNNFFFGQGNSPFLSLEDVIDGRLLN